MNKEKFTLFWGGEFSQWLSSKFVVDNVEYNCAEQYMMAQKAILFGDGEMLETIMGTDNPKTQKACGRNVKNFDIDVWNAHAKGIVFDGSMAKFIQNPDLLDVLVESEGTTLVEASPYDKVWGIGMGADNPNALIRANWKGTNWLGEILTATRDIILESTFKDIWKHRNNYTSTMKIKRR